MTQDFSILFPQHARKFAFTWRGEIYILLLQGVFFFTGGGGNGAGLVRLRAVGLAWFGVDRDAA
jgi:hypothetical protein